ncbi:uncharacterized protein LOC115884078 isoform X10 [Sitophilus oryzae]|uniref:Uncharacterized protein LOC115884078 isoform X10 n=1 Tax=Sitophilus oryzae TaxID=7048 RepID=A0A6J2Y602_SITOR|nr:uncharacterized protein LOC115884078 isoform X10 [Sitophilus oryzae]
MEWNSEFVTYFISAFFYFLGFCGLILILRLMILAYCFWPVIPQQQEQNVYSISGRVQGQEQQQRFPEAFVSVEHISIMNEMNKPPKYDDAPPSYEEAIKIAMAQNNSMETLRAEQAGVHQASSSSSVTVVQPAVPNRTTE